MHCKSKAERRLRMERLEDRLVLSVSLQSGPVPDDVVLFPAAQTRGFEIATGPVVAENLSMVDLSTVTSADQRHALSLSQGTFVQVDMNERYTLSLRSQLVAQEFANVLGIASFDVDKNQIDSLHVAKYAFATDTTLAAPLHPGDSSLLIENASGWSNATWESAETRALAWYGYVDSSGKTYADYTYTRNVAFDLDEGFWKPGAIRYDTDAGAYRIALLKPWIGPTLPTGAAIRNATSESTTPDFQVDSTFVPSPINAQSNWVEFQATFGGGEWQAGQPSTETFRPGTVFIQPKILILATDVVIGPEQDFSFGNPNDSTRPILETGNDRRVEIDLDVLGKRALVGVTGATDGDFDADGDRDGGDFLVWQRGLGTSHSANQLNEWEENFGLTGIVEIELVENPLHGTATISTNTSGQQVIHYRSDPWFVGTDIVRYTLRNLTTTETFDGSIEVEVLGGNVEQDPALVAILENQAQVTVGNEAPEKRFGDLEFVTATGQTLIGDGIRDFDLLRHMQDPTDQLVVRLLDGPDHGSLELNYDGTFEYVPVDGFSGYDTFRYEAFDGLNATSAVASIQVLETIDELLQRRMRKIALAMLNFGSAFGRFPAASGFDGLGNPYLSWRVHLLPFLEYSSLYDQFNLDEPWNSENNLPLLDQMPDIFRSVGDAPNSTTTRFQTFTGPDAPFGREVDGSNQRGPRLRAFADGAAHTLLFVESGANKAVSWTKPDDLEFDVNNPLAALGTMTAGPINAVTADGATIKLLPTIDPDDFKALVTINGGEIVDAGTLSRQYREENGSPPADPVDLATAETNQFKAIAFAFLNYANRNRNFPIGSSSASLYDENGFPHLSWRVHLLPYLGYQNLYSQFNLGEPWDSLTNLPLLSQMPDIFRSQGDGAASTSTRIRTFAAEGTGVGFTSRIDNTSGTVQRGATFNSFSDGLSNTVLFIEAEVDKQTPWTKPDYLLFDFEDPLASLGNAANKEIRVALADASLLTLPKDISPATFTALVTRSGGEDLNVATLRNRQRQSTGQEKSLDVRKQDLKTLVFAMHKYRDARIRFPGNRTDSEGTPLLSWRVELLPFLEQQNLYNQFRRNEPWDSPNNLALLQYMPDVFRSLGDPFDSTTTRVLHFTGPEAPFPSPSDSNQQGPRSQDLADGSSNTIAFVEAGIGTEVPWTKPSDLPFNTNNPLSALGKLGSEILAAYFDGSVRPLSSSVSTAELRARITHQGGEDLSNLPPHIPTSQVYVRQTAGDTVTNEFGVDWFDVVYDAPPPTQVTLALSTSDPTIALLDQSSLTFNASNWNIPQRVAVRGVDNFEINEDRTIQITVGSQTFSAIVIDDDLPPPSADFDADGDVDGADFLQWQRGFGLVGTATLGDGDSDADGDVTGDDLAIWIATFGQSGGNSLSTVVAELAAARIAPQTAPISDADYAHVAQAWQLLNAPSDGVVAARVDVVFPLEPPRETATTTIDLAMTPLDDEIEAFLEESPEIEEVSDPWLTNELLERVFGSAWLG